MKIKDDDAEAYEDPSEEPFDPQKSAASDLTSDADVDPDDDSEEDDQESEDDGDEDEETVVLDEEEDQEGLP